MRKSLIILFLFMYLSCCFAQNPLHNYKDAIQVQFDSTQPIIHYTVSVDTADLHLVSVEIDLRNISDTFYLGMYAHPEYDDRYWRFIEGIQAETPNEKTFVVRKDSALWRIVTHNRKAIVHYKLRLPDLPGINGLRSAWRPFLSANGGLLGDYHTFIYVVGETLAPAYVTFHIPRDWRIATGLEPTADPYTFFAPSAGVLLDAPVLTGKFKSWQFFVDGIPHTVAYWSLPNGVLFDSATLVTDIQKTVEEASALFGRLPYREYFFLLQDGSYGALEHNNSVTIGLPSHELAENIKSYLPEICHEYFHAWNMIRIRPVEYGDIDYKPAALSRGLWWSEGVTMFYTDLLLRRAGIANDTSSRINHLENLIDRYYNSPGNNKISLEKVSMADNAPPGFLGDYSASTHLQGEIIGDILDLIIRDAANGKYSIDELMRKMFACYGGEKGFTGKDIERLTTEICNCDVHSFFEDHVCGSKPIDFNKYLKLIGLRLDTVSSEAIDSNKNVLPDTRVYAWIDHSDNSIKLLITDPEGCWCKAGLHTGDIIRQVNDSAISSTNDFYKSVRNVHVGEVANIEVERNKRTSEINVKVTGHKQVTVHIMPLPNPSSKQLQIRDEWLAD
jgi:predicted metalloprotease with PDZ domain